MWPEQSLDFVKLPDDENGTHFGFFINDKLVSVVSLFINLSTNEAQFRKLATEINEQGNGYGTKLLSHLLEYTVQQKIERVWCNARLNKTSFYEKFGMVATQEKYIKEGVTFVIMEKTTSSLA